MLATIIPVSEKIIISTALYSLNPKPDFASERNESKLPQVHRNQVT